MFRAMPFDYYDRLSPSQQEIYRRSDAIHAVRLPPPARDELQDLARQLKDALSLGDAAVVQATADALVRGLCEALGVEAPDLVVHDVRPKNRFEELHGLYTVPIDGRPVIDVWMLTARKGRVVAFRTFLRTLIHEVLHHLDLAKFELPRSLHTEGFFMRLTSLFRQLVPPAPRRTLS